MDKFIDVARKVMARRHVELSAKQARLLKAAFERRPKARAKTKPKKAR